MFKYVQVVTTDIGQYVYCECFLTRFWSHKRQDKNLNILRRKRTFKVKQKAFFIISIGLSVVKNCPRPKIVPLIFISWLIEAEIISKSYGRLEIKNIYESICLSFALASFFFLVDEPDPRYTYNFVVSLGI